MLNFKLNTTKMPIYLDGKFELFEIKQTDDTYPIEYLRNTKIYIYYQELSISDRLRFEAEQREKKIEFKIRIIQNKNINSLCALKIEDKYYKVFNAYHFTNKDGYKETDITLENYPNVKLEDEI